MVARAFYYLLRPQPEKPRLKLRSVDRGTIEIETEKIERGNGGETERERDRD